MQECKVRTKDIKTTTRNKGADQCHGTAMAAQKHGIRHTLLCTAAGFGCLF